jgi:hypothetical protein
VGGCLTKTYRVNLKAKADNVFRFRWLESQLALLNKLSTVKDIRHALSVLPHTLFESYDRLLESIDETYTDLVIAALYLIIHSKESLTLVEIAGHRTN